MLIGGTMTYAMLLVKPLTSPAPPVVVCEPTLSCGERAAPPPPPPPVPPPRPHNERAPQRGSAGSVAPRLAANTSAAASRARASAAASLKSLSADAWRGGFPGPAPRSGRPRPSVSCASRARPKPKARVKRQPRAGSEKASGRFMMAIPRTATGIFHALANLAASSSRDRKASPRRKKSVSRARR